MAPVPTTVTAENPARYQPFTYPQFMEEYTGANYGERAAAGVALQGA